MSDYAGAAEQVGDGTDSPSTDAVAVEGDFSPRKIKIAAGILIGQSFATSITPFSAFSLVMIPLTHQFGWSRAEMSFASTFLFIFGAASLWPIGRLADRVGARPVLLLGTVIVGLVTLCLAFQTKSLTMLYVFYALLGVFGSTGVVYMKIIAALFTQNRGKAMAILGAESTVALAVIPLIANWLLLNYGWRDMYLAFGAIILAVVPVLYFTIEEPGEIGIRSRLFKKREAEVAAPPPRMAFDGMTILEAMRDRVFWMTIGAVMCGMVILTGMLAHMVPALIGKGFTQTQAVEMASLFLLAGLAGNLAGGWAVDRFHTAKTAAPFSLASALGAVMLYFLTASRGGMPVLVIATLLGGFAFGAYRPMGTYFQTRFFGLKAFTEIMSVQFAIVNPISAFSAPLIGLIFDRTHSYQIAFALMAAAPFIGAVVWLLLPSYRYAADIGQMPAPQPAE